MSRSDDHDLNGADVKGREGGASAVSCQSNGDEPSRLCVPPRGISGRLTRTGLWITIPCLALVVARVIASGRLIPAGRGVGIDVLWFMLVELLLLPWGLLLIGAGWYGQARARRLRSMAGRREIPALARVRLLLVAASLLGGVFVLDHHVVYPVLARELQWGRAGLGPPVDITSMEEVKRITSIWFPPGAVLLDGEFQGGLSPELIAKVSMPRATVTQFASQKALLWPHQWRDGSERMVTRASMPHMARRGWDPDSVRSAINLGAITRAAPEGVNMLIDLDDSRTAIVYLDWSS